MEKDCRTVPRASDVQRFDGPPVAVNGRNRELFAHLLAALAQYVPEAQRRARHNGLPPPPDLLWVVEVLEICAGKRLSATENAGELLASQAAAMYPMLTKREAAAELRISVRSLERLIKADRLTAVLVESAVRIRRADLDAYVAALGPRHTFRDQIEEKAG